MLARVIKPFKRRGEIIPPGSIIELPEHILPQLEGYIVPADNYTPKAWLTESGELRTNGYIPDLAGEIVKLTTGNLPLQRELLQRHCEGFDSYRIQHKWELWEERAAILEHDGGMTRQEAEQEAAKLLHLTAFI